MRIKEGDRVRFLNADLHENDPEYYPPVGTEGTVQMICPKESGLDQVALVTWHLREAMNETWYAPFAAIEKVRHAKKD